MIATPVLRHANSSDDTLVGSAVRGDVDAFGALVERHERSARSLAAALVGPSDADDVAQDSFVRAYRSLASFRRGSPFRPWLLSIVANQAANHHRSARRRERRLGVVGRRPPLPDLDPADLAVQSDEQKLVRTALDTLSTKDRNVLVFRYLLECSEHETAEALHCSPGTVKSRTSRALTKLRAQMMPERNEGADA